METKTNLKESTESNYRYLWEHYIQHESIAEKALSKIHKSDVKLLYAKLLQEGFASNSLESINNLIHPVLELAVDDDLIRKNPSNGVYREMKTNAPVQRIASHFGTGKALSPIHRILATVLQLVTAFCNPVRHRDAGIRMYRSGVG